MQSVHFLYDDKIDQVAKINDNNLENSELLLIEYLNKKHSVNAVRISKSAEDARLDPEIKDGFLITPDWSVYEKKTITNEGYIWNSYDTQIRKVGHFIVSKDEISEQEQREKIRSVVDTYVAIMRKDSGKENIKHMHELAIYMQKNKELFRRLDKQDPIYKLFSEWLHFIDISIEKNKERHPSWSKIFDSKFYIKELLD